MKVTVTEIWPFQCRQPSISYVVLRRVFGALHDGTGGLGRPRGDSPPENISHVHFDLLVENVDFQQQRCSCQLTTLKVLYNDNECLKLDQIAGSHV